jgi:hypothetical protein
MNLPNLEIAVPSNISSFAKSKGKQFDELFQLVYLVGLTIPEELAKGSRIENYFNTEESKDK